jgi:hypothetical protein
VHDVAAARLRTYEVLVEGVRSALRTESHSLVEAALDGLFLALSGDMCAVEYDDGTNQRGSPDGDGVFRRQLAVRAIVLRGSEGYASVDSALLGTSSSSSSLAGARVASHPSQQHQQPAPSSSSSSCSVSEAVVQHLGQAWEQSPLSSADVLQLLHRCLGSRLLGPRVRRRAGLVALALLGFDAGCCGDLLGPTAAPTPEALEADRDIVLAAWRAAAAAKAAGNQHHYHHHHHHHHHRASFLGGSSKQRGFGSQPEQHQELFAAAVFLPRPADCSIAELRAALRTQGLEHRRAFGERTTVLHTLLDALFEPDTTTAMRLQ